VRQGPHADAQQAQLNGSLVVALEVQREEERDGVPIIGHPSSRWYPFQGQMQDVPPLTRPLDPQLHLLALENSGKMTLLD
jgi:hypothetical protein